MTLFQLVEAGYASSLAEARKLTATEVVHTLHRIQFRNDWEDKYWELNK